GEAGLRARRERPAPARARHVGGPDHLHPSMKIDVLLIPVGARYPEMRAAALAAEESGFDGVWTWDHLRDPDEAAEAGVPEAWTVLDRKSTRLNSSHPS